MLVTAPLICQRPNLPTAGEAAPTLLDLLLLDSTSAGVLKLHCDFGDFGCRNDQDPEAPAEAGVSACGEQRDSESILPAWASLRVLGPGTTGAETKARRYEAKKSKLRRCCAPEPFRTGVQMFGAQVVRTCPKETTNRSQDPPKVSPATAPKARHVLQEVVDAETDTIIGCKCVRQGGNYERRKPGPPILMWNIGPGPHKLEKSTLVVMKNTDSDDTNNRHQKQEEE